MGEDKGNRSGGQAADTDERVELEGPESAPGWLLDGRGNTHQRHVDGHIPQGQGRCRRHRWWRLPSGQPLIAATRWPMG
jgi:hypothetical protein